MEPIESSPEPNPNPVPDKAAQQTKGEKVAVGWMGYFDTVSKILAGVAFAAWMVEEWTGIKILLFVAIVTGIADFFI